MQGNIVVLDCDFGPSGSKMKDRQKTINLHEWSLSVNDHFAAKWTYAWWRVIFCSLFRSAFCNSPICSAHMISVNCVECLISVGAETSVLHCCQLRCDVEAIFKLNPLRANNRRCCQHWVRRAACTMELVLWLSVWLFVAIITASIIATKPATDSQRANPFKRRRESVFVLFCCSVVYEITNCVSRLKLCITWLTNMCMLTDYLPRSTRHYSGEITSVQFPVPFYYYFKIKYIYCNAIDLCCVCKCWSCCCLTTVLWHASY